HLFRVVVNVREGDKTIDGVEPLAECPAFAKIIERDVALVSEEPGEDGRRVPVTPNRTFHDLLADVDPSAWHLAEVHVPMAGLLSHEETQSIREVNDPAVVRVVGQAY